MKIMTEKYFEHKYKECKNKESDEEKTDCLFDVLHEITELQDNIQLAIPRLNDSVMHSTNLTNNANGILLNISQHKGNIKNIVRDGYVKEKIDYLIWRYNDLVHDYNITKEKDFLPKIKCEKDEYRTEPAPIKTREWMKKTLFGKTE